MPRLVFQCEYPCDGVAIGKPDGWTCGRVAVWRWEDGEMVTVLCDRHKRALLEEYNEELRASEEKKFERL